MDKLHFAPVGKWLINSQGFILTGSGLGLSTASEFTFLFLLPSTRSLDDLEHTRACSGWCTLQRGYAKILCKKVVGFFDSSCVQESKVWLCDGNNNGSGG